MTAASPSSPNANQPRQGFKIHATVFAVVISLLAALDWYTGEPYWIHWVLLGWGVGLAGHAWLIGPRKMRGAAQSVAGA
jgi:2TM domain